MRTKRSVLNRDDSNRKGRVWLWWECWCKVRGDGGGCRCCVAVRTISRYSKGLNSTEIYHMFYSLVRKQHSSGDIRQSTLTMDLFHLNFLEPEKGKTQPAITSLHRRWPTWSNCSGRNICPDYQGLKFIELILRAPSQVEVIPKKKSSISQLSTGHESNSELARVILLIF